MFGYVYWFQGALVGGLISFIIPLSLTFTAYTKSPDEEPLESSVEHCPNNWTTPAPKSDPLTAEDLYAMTPHVISCRFHVD